MLCLLIWIVCIMKFSLVNVQSLPGSGEDMAHAEQCTVNACSANQPLLILL